MPLPRAVRWREFYDMARVERRGFACSRCGEEIDKCDLCMTYFEHKGRVCCNNGYEHICQGCWEDIGEEQDGDA